METVPFPWKNELKETAAQELSPKKLNWKPYIGPGIFILILICLAVYNRSSNRAMAQGTAPSNDVVVLLLMTPMAAGEAIEPEVLKEVLVSRNELTKNQVLERLKKEDLVKLRGKLFAKKDLPSSRPIFWKDVTLKRNSKSMVNQPSFEIHSPKGVSQ